MSQRAYARHRAQAGLRGTSHRAVQKALAAGRITANTEGLVDSEVADRAWATMTSEGHLRNKAREAPLQNTHAEPATAGGLTFAQANAVEKAYRARLARLDYEERVGKLVPAAEVRAEWLKIVTASRNKVLGLPTKIRQRLQHLSHSDVATIEKLVRETLEDLGRSQPGEEPA